MTTEQRSRHFVEVCIYEVKADRAADFEELLEKVVRHHSQFPGVIDVRYLKRTHRPVDFGGARRGEPAIKLTRAASALTYVVYWELTDEIAHAEATKSGLEHFYKDFRRCVARPPKIILGNRV